MKRFHIINGSFSYTSIYTTISSVHLFCQKKNPFERKIKLKKPRLDNVTDTSK